MRRKYFRSGLIPLVITSLFLIYIPPSANAATSTILGTTGTSPFEITIDSSGNIYTANDGSNNVSKITPAGVSSILGTTGDSPRGITIDLSGNIYTANYSTNNVSKITILDAPAFTLSSSSGSANAGSAISPYTVNSTGGAIASYSISPAVGNGLSFNSTTGVISGTPATAAAAVTYTITATNTSGTATATYSLTINADPTIVAAEAARVAEVARVAAANAEAARKAKEQKELTEILAIIPKIAELTLGLGETTKSLYSTKCVKGKTTKYVKYGAKCPKGYKKK